MNHPASPLAAVTHPDPYPYYSDLVTEHPFYRDDALGLWVAASAEAVSAVLASKLCHVRPVAEPVPKAIQGSPLGEIFGRLVRQNDGPERHHTPRQAIAAALASIDDARLARIAEGAARQLAGDLQSGQCTLTDYNFRLPIHIVGGLLGVAREKLDTVASWINGYVLGVAPSASADAIEQGNSAAGNLLALMRECLRDADKHAERRLLGVLSQQSRDLGIDDPDIVVANAIGLLVQTYEATSGLIGNTLVELGLRPDVRRAVEADPELLVGVIWEILRFNPSVQNTRRFVVEDGVLCGQQMRAGETILVILAAANRDPQANANPSRFEPARAEPRTYAFGTGAHACPGAALAVAIARVGVGALISRGLAPRHPPGGVTYRPSANGRIPI